MDEPESSVGRPLIAALAALAALAVAVVGVLVARGVTAPDVLPPRRGLSPGQALIRASGVNQGIAVGGFVHGDTPGEPGLPEAPTASTDEGDDESE